MSSNYGPTKATSEQSAGSALRTVVRCVLRDLFVTGWVLFALILTLIGGVSIAGSMVAPPARAPAPITRVFGVERLRDIDLLIVEDGTLQAGRILNKTFTLRTPYAELRFEQRLLAGIDLDRHGRVGEAIVTINSNQFSGLLEDSVFTLESQTGSRIKLRREKVRRAIFGVQETELRGLPQGRWIRLSNGDWCSGLSLEPIRFATTSGPAALKMEEIGSLAFGTNVPWSATVVLRNGQTLQGSFAQDDVPLVLDLGMKLSIYKDYVAAIAVRPEERAEDSNPVSTQLPPAVQDKPSPALVRTNEPPASLEMPGAVAISATGTNVAGMVWIPAGTFTMGSPLDEAGRDQDEGPQTRVTLSHGFWMGAHEVTQGEYRTVMGTNPSVDRGSSDLPVEKVSWYDAMEYCARLTKKAQTLGRLPAGCFYRLPTEAEWEYACRAGTTTRFSYGDDRGDLHLGDYAWFTRNSQSATHPVETLRPNPWGLYDMHGNVWEWCLDRWESSLPGGSVTNFPSSAEGPLRVARGGSWLYEAKACRSANRDDYSPSNRCSDVGFRVVLAPMQP